MRTSLLLAALLWSGIAPARTDFASRIVVDKSNHELYVFAGTKKVATYPVSLGVQPFGAKDREGDRRTPEGKYLLDSKNAGSAYFRSIHISYPNVQDAAKARKLGVRPGGAIMIHGQPNDPMIREAVRWYPLPDWTNGCIALSNADMQKLWDVVRVPIPIEIIP